MKNSGYKQKETNFFISLTAHLYIVEESRLELILLDNDRLFKSYTLHYNNLNPSCRIRQKIYQINYDLSGPNGVFFFFRYNLHGRIYWDMNKEESRILYLYSFFNFLTKTGKLSRNNKVVFNRILYDLYPYLCHV